MTQQQRHTDVAVVIRRVPGGWAVGDDPDPLADLTSAMVLADLIAGDSTTSSRPPRPGDELDEVARLQLSVRQLQHALASRILIEQAIGVLAERRGSTPREAFELLRKVARSRGAKVHDLAQRLMDSVRDGSVALPAELPKRRP